MMKKMSKFSFYCAVETFKTQE